MIKSSLFIDTGYIYALINPNDQWHQKAVEWQQKLALENYPLITTEFVLTEIANGLSAVKFRQDAGHIIHILQDAGFCPNCSRHLRTFSARIKFIRKSKRQGLGLNRLHLFCGDGRK